MSARYVRQVVKGLPSTSGQNGRTDLGLRDRVYLVTGGSRGLGFAAARTPTKYVLACR
jgi:hypothetical protein